MKKVILIIIVVLVAAFVILQVIPYGRNHKNPPVVKEPTWDKPQTRELAKRACFDCHSNETFWPWYSNIAPVSWLVQRDVNVGRGRLNFSDWGRGEQEIGEVAEIILEGEMPPSYYILLHPKANLSQAEKEGLIQGLQATLGIAGGGG